MAQGLPARRSLALARCPWLLLSALTLLGCGSGDDEGSESSSGSGGTTSSGTASSGGATALSGGGTSKTGGATGTSTGGTTSTGTSTGGSTSSTSATTSSTGGSTSSTSATTNSTGGSTSATGGSSSTGGTTAVTSASYTCGAWDAVLDATILSNASGATLIDFNEASRQESETNESGYEPWPTGDVSTESLTVNGVTFTVTMAGSGGTSLTTDWYKVGVQSPNYARLVCDGLTVKDGNSGGAIELEISGLSAGTHTLLAYHNGVDGNQLAAMNVDVNGTRQLTGIVPTNRALSTDAAASSYVTFTATAGQTVTILYSPDSSSSSSYKNVIINGLALDVPNSSAQASGESPSDRDFHTDADAGSVTLSWTAASNAVSHEVYFGTDATSVASATTSSAEYKGSQTGTSYEVSGLSNLQFYWWRIDETDSNGVTTKGKVWSFAPRHLAFRAAGGYGRFSRGGRCGKVVHVTNLNDSGTGSLREAVTNDVGPRTIVFDVSGLIKLESRLTLTQHYITVAGQTAPGKGIVVRAAPFGASGNTDLILQNIRVRLGAGTTYDGMGLTGSDYSIVDHASISWTIDEGFSSRGAKNITLQRTMISECLNIAGHANYPAGTAHGYAGSISGDIGSFHHNLLAHCEGRNWSLAGGLDGDGYFAGRLDIFSTVVYNWDGRTTDGGAHEVNFVNNYYKPGEASSVFTALNLTYDAFPGTQQYYMAGNVMPGYFDESNQEDGWTLSSTNAPTTYSPWVSAPFFESYAPIDSAEEAYKNVLSDVGMTQPLIDDHDTRIIKETLNGTYTYTGSVSGIPGLPDTEDDVGGYEDYPEETRSASFDSDGDGLPNWYETYLGTSTASSADDFTDSNADPDGDGYTNLEEYLDWMNTPHAEVASGSSVTFDLAALFRGYTQSPSYAAGTATCLTASVSSSTLTVTPTSTCGIVYLPVTVTDSEGSTMTREVAVFVTGSVL